MIKTEKQRRITEAQLASLEAVVSQLDDSPQETEMPSDLYKAQRTSIEELISNLRAQLADYEQLKKGKQRAFVCTSFAQLPEVLTRARIAAGLTQEELGDRIGVKKQQVNHYEVTKYAGASFLRLYEVMDALSLRVRIEVSLPETASTSESLTLRVTDIIDSPISIAKVSPPSSVKLISNGQNRACVQFTGAEIVSEMPYAAR